MVYFKQNGLDNIPKIGIFVSCNTPSCSPETPRNKGAKLPSNILDALALLIVDLQETGPVQTRWPHYGKIRGKEGVHHCHLNKGKPRYVAVWRESKEQLELLEIRYVGTHENADYSRID